MEFIGDDDSAAPTIKEKPPEKPNVMYRTLIKYVHLLYTKAKLVHSDLSEYNVMNVNNSPVIFDMSQSVAIEHPNADQYLVRDLKSLNKFFEKLGVKVRKPEALFKWVKKNE